MLENELVDLQIKLKANGSSGNQLLWLSAQTINEGIKEFFWTLTGNYRGESIQIDFGETTKDELLEIRAMIDLIIEA